MIGLGLSLWNQQGGNPFFTGASVDLNFATGSYFGVAGAPSSFLTTTRAAPATSYASDVSGNWLSFAANTPRVTNKGLLIEEQRTNSIRNNSMQGAVAGVIGSGGAVPTNWGNPGGNAATSFNIIGTGTQNGVDYMDVRVTGSPTIGQFNVWVMEGAQQIAAAYGQTWSGSVFLALIGGSFANVGNAFNMIAQENTAGGASIIQDAGPVVVGSITSTLTRFTSKFFTLSSPTCAFVQPIFGFNYPGGPVDFTVRVGWPQLENNNITVGVASATVANGGTAGTYAVNDVLTVVGGAGTAATLTVTGVNAGQVTTVTPAVIGVYSTFPPSPASVTGGGGTGATFTLVPINSVALAFSTSPIRTTAAAVTRNKDVVSMAIGGITTSLTIFGQGIPLAPLLSQNSQVLVQANASGTPTNRTLVFRQALNGFAAQAVVGGTEALGNGTTVWADGGVSGKLALAFGGTSDIVFNGVAQAGHVSAGEVLPTGIDTLWFGQQFNGLIFWNGYISRVAVFPSTLTQAQCALVTT